MYINLRFGLRSKKEKKTIRIRSLLMIPLLNECFWEKRKILSFFTPENIRKGSARVCHKGFVIGSGAKFVKLRNKVRLSLRHKIGNGEHIFECRGDNTLGILQLSN